jgi:hypothetical protein
MAGRTKRLPQLLRLRCCIAAARPRASPAALASCSSILSTIPALITAISLPRIAVHGDRTEHPRDGVVAAVVVEWRG